MLPSVNSLSTWCLSNQWNPFQLPNTTVFVHGVEQIVDSEVRAIPQIALVRFQEIGVKIEHSVGAILIPMLLQVRAARDQFRMHAHRLTNLTEALVSNIQLKTIRSARSFEDVYDRFGYDRSAFNSLVCGLLFIVSRQLQHIITIAKVNLCEIRWLTSYFPLHRLSF